MIFLLSYWKQLLAVGVLVIVLPVTYYKGYESGKAHIQAEWYKQQIVDANAVAVADNKTATITKNSEKVTQNENLNLAKKLGNSTNYYSSHPVPNVVYRVCKSDGEGSSSQVSTIPDTTQQPNTTTTDSVSRTDYEKLANDCLATTLQLDNAQEWAKQQVEVNAE